MTFGYSMAIISIINKKNVEGFWRIEAEYYKPNYLELLSKLKNVPNEKLIKLTNFIKKGIFDLPPSNYSSEGIPLIRTTEIKSEIATLTECVRIPEAIHNKHLNNELNSGDIVFTKIGANIGDTSYLPSNETKYNFSQNVAGAKIKNEKVKKGYLSAFLQSYYGRQQIKRVQMLSGQGKLELVDLRNLLIFLPTDLFQVKTDHIYRTADTFLINANQAYSNANDILLRELNLLTWQPQRNITFIKNYSNTQHSFRIDAEHFKPKYDEMLNRIPTEVELFPLRKYVNYKKGIEVGGDQYTESGKKFIRVSNLTKYRLDEQNINFISENLYEDLKNSFEPQQGEILLSKDATPGIAFYLSEQPEGIISSGILRLQFINDIPPHYLELVLNSLFVQLQIEKQAGGSIIIHWKPNEVMRTLIPRLGEAKEIEINNLVEQSHQQRKLSKKLIEIAKQGVEKAIEFSEAEAENFINTELEKLGVNINSNT